jgi:hypothetical protein
MVEKTYVIRVKVEKEQYDNYDEIEQTLYDLGAIDVDLLEVYDD